MSSEPSCQGAAFFSAMLFPDVGEEKQLPATSGPRMQDLTVPFQHVRNSPGLPSSCAGPGGLAPRSEGSTGGSETIVQEISPRTQ